MRSWEELDLKKPKHLGKLEVERAVSPLRSAVKTGGNLLTGEEALLILNLLGLATDEEKARIADWKAHFEEVLAAARAAQEQGAD